MTAAITTAAVRAAILARLRAAGAEFAMLAAFVAVAANLVDFATLPVPGEGVTGGFVAAVILRILAVFYATYAITRRMAEVAAPFRPGAALLRFFLLSIVAALLSGLVTGGGMRLLGGRELTLASQWLAMLSLGAAFSVLTVRLIGWSPALAAGAPFAALPGVFRASRGAAVPLALAFLQVVLPFAAIHLALALLGARLPLSGTAMAALALVDGVVSAAQLLLASALGVVAWQLAGNKAGALREPAAGR